MIGSGREAPQGDTTARTAASVWRTFVSQDPVPTDTEQDQHYSPCDGLSVILRAGRGGMLIVRHDLLWTSEHDKATDWAVARRWAPEDLPDCTTGAPGMHPTQRFDVYLLRKEERD